MKVSYFILGIKIDIENDNKTIGIPSISSGDSKFTYEKYD